MRKTNAAAIALGGILAALAAVIMCFGSAIPVNTYVCPVLCTVLGQVVLRSCGRRISWAWYGVVCILSLLFAPDKEAAFVYVMLGYYPMLKPIFDRSKLKVLWKILYFNLSAAACYAVLIWVLGMYWLLAEFTWAGTLGLAVTLFLGNGMFFMLDFLLVRLAKVK